jgi:RNA polymerase sigma-70 factor (ECF subfamily)
MNRVELFNQHRPLLLSIAYRMLGSVADAEDMVQEAYLRWQGAAGEEISEPRAYLATVVTRLCVDHLKSARSRHELPQSTALPELVGTEDGDPFASATMADSLAIAFLVVLQTLRPVERAVFLLHDVFDFDHAAIAAAVGKSEQACRQILRRAKRRISERRPPLPGPRAEVAALTERFLAAGRAGDAAGLLALLAEDVTFIADGGPGAASYGRARAIARPLHGAQTVARFLLAVQRQAPVEVQYQIADVNGRPAIVTYRDGRVFSVVSLDIAEHRVRTIYVVSDPEKLASLGALRFAH